MIKNRTRPGVTAVHLPVGAPAAGGPYFSDDAQTEAYYSDDAQTTPYQAKD